MNIYGPIYCRLREECSRVARRLSRRKSRVEDALTISTQPKDTACWTVPTHVKIAFKWNIHKLVNYYAHTLF
jgi:hypothetical protein